ncbi:hypothetical protein SDC9_60101 [bioreactor metagenome]|uniref:Uncharacterized protein n=1 Tax=bioreactor metagenome TaxID=1076179 RepID=A0A644XC32_9ZZZZ
MINVIDAIMGSGKSQSSIKYMNDHPEQRFVYVTPYLDEAKRIKDGCPTLEFVEPNKMLPEFKFSKLNHCKYLLKHGRNIASTHQLFSMFDDEAIASIKEYVYTVIIDEVVDVFTKSDYSVGDIQLLIDAGYIVQEEDGTYRAGDIEYTGTRLNDLFLILKHNRLIKISSTGKSEYFYYWIFPIEVIKAFKDVFILTYLFESQDMKHYFTINNIPYRYMGIQRRNGTYEFSETVFDIPNYVRDIKNKITVIDNEKLNRIGKGKYDISDNWFRRAGESNVKQLKDNLYNYFRFYSNSSSAKDNMWATFDGRKTKLRGKGYASGYVVFNKRATNELRNKTALAYCSNIFVRPEKKHYFEQFGIEYDEDTYALSVLIQWIWRSAIRDGESIVIYIPVKRMRDLLLSWIDSFSNST